MDLDHQVALGASVLDEAPTHLRGIRAEMISFVGRRRVEGKRPLRRCAHRGKGRQAPAGFEHGGHGLL